MKSAEADIELLRYSPSRIKIVTHEGKKTAQLLCFNQLKQIKSREDEKEEETQSKSTVKIIASDGEPGKY